MNLQKNENKTTSISPIEIADTISELTHLLEKIGVLTEDISQDFFEKIDLKSERGRFTAEYDINILKLKWAIMIEYIYPAINLSGKLVSYSSEIIKGNNK